MRLEALFNPKCHRVVAISKEQPVERALAQLVKEKIGALLVTTGGKPWGLFTSDDLLRCLHRHPRHSLADLQIEKVISGKLVTAEIGDPVGSTVAKMINTGISHLVIMQEQAAMGMVSLIDLMAFQIKILMSEIDGLEGYITDLQNAELD